MKELIKKFVEQDPLDLIEEANEIKKEYEEDVRICVSSSHNQGGTGYYYYDPETGEVARGVHFPGSGSSNYSYKEIGLIEISVNFAPNLGECDYLNVERIIQPVDEDMSYADDWEEKKFDCSIEDHNSFSDLRNTYPVVKLINCINCNKKYIVNEEGVMHGEYMVLDERETEIICSDCTNQDISIVEFLETVENPSKKEEYRNYFASYVGVDLEENLFA